MGQNLQDQAGQPALQGWVFFKRQAHLLKERFPGLLIRLGPQQVVAGHQRGEAHRGDDLAVTTGTEGEGKSLGIRDRGEMLQIPGHLGVEEQGQAEKTVRRHHVGARVPQGRE
jgi:hypothetical protein